MICDEVTTIDNQNCLSVHVYVMENWKMIPILFNLQRLKIVAIFDNLISLIVKNLIEYGGLSDGNYKQFGLF